MWRKSIFYVSVPRETSVESGVHVRKEAEDARKGRYRPMWAVVVDKPNLVVIFSESQECFVLYGDRGD